MWVFNSSFGLSAKLKWQVYDNLFCQLQLSLASLFMFLQSLLVMLLSACHPLVALPNVLPFCSVYWLAIKHINFWSTKVKKFSLGHCCRCFWVCCIVSLWQDCHIVAMRKVWTTDTKVHAAVDMMMLLPQTLRSVDWLNKCLVDLLVDWFISCLLRWRLLLM